MTYNPAKLDDVVGFLNQVNRAIYGVAPFTVKIPVRHDIQPENEVVINGVWCDIGSHYVSEGELHSNSSILFDASVCEGCYEHYN